MAQKAVVPTLWAIPFLILLFSSCWGCVLKQLQSFCMSFKWVGRECSFLQQTSESSSQMVTFFNRFVKADDQLSQIMGQFSLNGLFLFLPIAPPPLCPLKTHPFSCSSGGQRGTFVSSHGLGAWPDFLHFALFSCYLSPLQLLVGPLSHTISVEL